MVADTSGQLHFPYNAPPEDHSLKRQYLALLPPQQVIEICLALDIHVPMALKRNIWPPDFKAVLASMQNPPKAEEAPNKIPSSTPAASSTTNEAHPTAASDDQSPQTSTERKPPDKPPVAGPSTPNTSSLQPFNFSSQPASAYPHTPYYHQPLPPGYLPFSFPYAAGPSSAAHHPYPLPPPLSAPGYPAPNPYFAAPHQQDASIPVPAPASEDTDLPSYEDMIVEGLTTVADPEGMAPKDLFNWISARYPVQANFRPSASQALQKAYRRGRFEKNASGRYRLNASWEGGNSSTRRATRRPQTHNATPIVMQKQARMPNGASPFTPIPRPSPQAFVPAPPPVSPYPASQPTPAPTPAAAPTEPPRPIPPTEVPPPKPSVPPNSAYQAAEKILQTINFGAVFSLEDEAARRMSPVKSESVSLSLAEHARAELQGQLALLAAQLEDIAQLEADAEAAAHDEDGI
ncbi:unnamed protein product [Mycena citricolor]|uniref:Histone H1 n=1 Tax=Mycena citricolor TaxID=2018698 RepID=A0AAD2H849_9AGAR|nr:unnamed protein product [Mycena citricolor]CAK5270338.1 unnamed protein product [Mycena citricolor]